MCGADKTMHSKVKSRIIIINRSKEILDFDISIQFFVYFSKQGLFFGLVGFDFSAGKFPLADKITITSLGGGDF